MDAMLNKSERGSPSIKGPITVVAAVIRNEQEQILIARRPDSHLVAGGLWEFPGGKVEAGESPAEALLREIKEELGIEIEVKNLIDVVSHVYPMPSAPLHILLIGYFADFVGGKIQLNDVAEVEWVPNDRRPPHQFAPADLPLLEKVWPNKR